MSTSETNKLIEVGRSTMSAESDRVTGFGWLEDGTVRAVGDVVRDLRPELLP